MEPKLYTCDKYSWNLYKSLNKLKSTRIVIAHRLSTVIKADRIIVLSDGRIVQDGNYQELIAVPGLFQDLATRQIA